MPTRHAAPLIFALLAALPAGSVAQGIDTPCLQRFFERCGDVSAAECFSESKRWDQLDEVCIGQIQSMIEMEREANESDDTLATRNVRDLEGMLFGLSYGGRLRSAPDMESLSIASLQEGERIRILENTGTRMGEYIWYRVLTQHGEGFHWGGIFCADSEELLEGVLSRCDQASRDQVMGINVVYPDPVQLVLRGDGVQVENGVMIGFGSAQHSVIELISEASQEGPEYQELLSDCGPGALEVVGWNDGFSAYFQDQRFVGWTAIDQRTAEGIGFGSSRKELLAAYDARIEKSSLGIEFEAGGISGVLESSANDAQINGIWAGLTCLMR